MNKRLLLFGLILCLIVVSGWTGMEFPFQSSDAGELYYQPDKGTSSTGMSKIPLSEKTVILTAKESCIGRETENQSVIVKVDTDLFLNRVSNEETGAFSPQNTGDNDQLNWIAIAPRA